MILKTINLSCYLHFHSIEVGSLVKPVLYFPYFAQNQSLKSVVEIKLYN